MSNQCELCSKTAAGHIETTYYGFEVFICNDCKDTEPYLEKIEGLTKCLCNNWFDRASLRTHEHKGPCSTANIIGFDLAETAAEESVTFIHNQEHTHAF